MTSARSLAGAALSSILLVAGQAAAQRFGLWSRGVGASEAERNTGQVDEIIDRWWRQDRSALNAGAPASSGRAPAEGAAADEPAGGEGPPPGPPAGQSEGERKLAELAAMLAGTNST